MDLHLLQKEAADVLGVSTNTVLGWEKWGRKPSIQQWPAIIRFLGYDPVGKAETFAELLREARRRLGCSHYRFGKIVGFDQSTIYKWEHGKIPRNVRSWEKLEVVFETLGMSLSICQRHWPRRYRRRKP